jgi:tetratricopeptide (TPR) repeat protein
MLSLLAALALQAPHSAPDEPGFRQGCAEVQGLIERRRWRDAYARTQALFDEHADAPYVVERAADLEADLVRCAFWMTHAEPRLEDLLAARLEHWDPYRGSVRLAFDGERLGDLDARPAPGGTVYELPLAWDSAWTATLEGAAEALAGVRLYVLLDDGAVYAIALGRKAQGVRGYEKHDISLHEKDRITPLKSAVPAETREGERVTARLTVTETRIRLEVARATVLDAPRADGGGLGRLAFSRAGGGAAIGDFGTLVVEGRAATGWFDGLVDTAVQQARAEFEASWNAAEHMPAWLVSGLGDANDVGAALGPFPVPEAFDLVVEPHPRTAEHVARVEAFLAQGRPAAALDALRELRPDEIAPTLRAFLGCLALLVSDRPREAFAVGERLWRDQPDSLTAGYLEAVLNAELRRPAVALERFRRLTEAHPEAWEPWYGRTSLLLLQRRVDDALAVLAEGRERAASSEELRRLAGRLALLSKGPPWDRVFEERVEHFHIRSDTDAVTTRAVAREVQRAWRTYERVLGPIEIAPDAPFPVFLFSGAATYHAYASSALSADRQHTAGLFSRDRQVLLVWNTPSSDTLFATLRHEVLHQYLDARIGAVPTWLNEGLAEYYEIATAERGLPALGEPHPAHVPRLRALAAVPDLRALIRSTPEAFHASGERSYPLAWGLVHFLQHSTLDRRRRFESLWAELEAGADGTTALDRAFAGVDWDAWNRAFREHLAELSDGRK